jgi:hypothetical protein
LTTIAALTLSASAAGAVPRGWDRDLGAQQAADAAAAVGPAVRSLPMKARANRLIATGEDVTVATPRSASSDVTLTTEAGELSLGLPQVAASSAQITADGAVVYDGASVDIVVQAEEAGVRMQTVLNSAEAPTEYLYALPAGAEILSGPSGPEAIAVGDALFELKPAWAFDADGTPVPTRFIASEAGLVQVVDHAAGSFTYPVVADPHVITGTNWFFGGPFVATRGSRSDTQKVAYWAGSVVAVTTALGFPGIVTGPVGTAMLAGIRTGAAAISAYALAGLGAGKCIEVRYYTAAKRMYWIYWGC